MSKIHRATEPIADLIHGRKRKKSPTIREYTDAIQIAQRDTTIAKINLEKCKYYYQGAPTKIHTNISRGAKQRMNIIRTKIMARRIILRLLLKCDTRKLEHGAEHLQKEAAECNMIPIWKYLETLRGATKHDRNYVLTKSDGTQTRTPL